MFSPESSLWKRKTLNNYTLTSVVASEKYEVTQDTLAKEKMEHMGISADLTLKFMGDSKSFNSFIFDRFLILAGFLQLHGHFGYIVDKVDKEEEVFVSTKYENNRFNQ